MAGRKARGSPQSLCLLVGPNNLQLERLYEELESSYVNSLTLKQCEAFDAIQLQVKIKT